MLYIVRVNIDPVNGAALEQQPEVLQDLVGTWQSLNPVGMYFALTEREVTVVAEAANEDELFEALHKTWVVTNTYPTVTPVVTAEDFPQIIERILG